MIKDVFVLKTSSWHMKLLHWMWNVDSRDFSHMCPYFWLGMFSIIILPIYCVIRIVVKGIEYLFNYFDNLNTKSIEKWRADYMAKLLADDNEKQKFAMLNLNKKCNKRYYDFFHWYLGCEYKNLYEQLLQLRHTYLFNLAPKEKTNKQKITQNLKWIKPVTKVILFLLAAGTLLVVGFYGYKFVLWIAAGHFRPIDWNKVLTAVMSIGIILVGIVIVILLSNIKLSCNTKRTLASPFKFIWSGIRGFFSFIGQMFSDNCPAVRWED